MGTTGYNEGTTRIQRGYNGAQQSYNPLCCRVQQPTTTRCIHSSVISSRLVEEACKQVVAALVLLALSLCNADELLHLLSQHLCSLSLHLRRVLLDLQRGLHALGVAPLLPVLAITPLSGKAAAEDAQDEEEEEDEDDVGDGDDDDEDAADVRASRLRVCARR